jgi:glycerophosphoryl diester phosphodiesterase
MLRESPKLARRLHKRGRRMHVWTVNDPADLDLCVRLGAEVVITDDPRQALDHLDGPPRV